MAHPAGRPGPPVAPDTPHRSGVRSTMPEALLKNPKEFSFSQAVRLLKQACTAPGAQDRESFLREQLRVRPYLSLGFPSNDLVDIQEPARKEDDAENAPRRFKLTATFLGLYGPSSPLPTYYTEELLSEQSEDKSVGRDFLDILNHGFFVLFILADTYYRLSRRVVEEDDREMVSRLFALAGLGHAEMREKIFHQPGALLRAMGLLTQFPRSAAGLRGILADRIGAPVAVRQCTPREAVIPEDQCCRLSRSDNALGQNAWLGFTVTDAMGKIAISVGPMNAGMYQGYMPGRPEFDELVRLVRFYCTQPLIFDLEFILAPGEAQPARLGEEQWSCLGCDAWLAPDPELSARAVFPDHGRL